MKNPIIGISGSIMRDNDDMFAGHMKAYVVEDYVDSVLRAGGIPLILPIFEDDDKISAITSLIDGLILTGGHDINPLLYNEEPNLKLTETLPERDLFDFTLIKHMDAKEKPILGICRGLQVLNVYHGGTLFQDNSQCDTFRIKHMQGHNPTQATHSIIIEPDSILNTLLENETIVNSFHHQSVKDLAKGFKVTARSKDNIIEAIEKESSQFCIGLQFHPELLSSNNTKMQSIFNLFIEKSKNNNQII